MAGLNPVRKQSFVLEVYREAVSSSLQIAYDVNPVAIHIDHSIVDIIAGDGLTGGGNIMDDVTLAVDDAYVLDLMEESMEPLANRLDEDATPGIHYYGEAAPGSLDSAPAWRIRRLDETGATSVELLTTWASGNNAKNKRWDLRATYIYS